MIWSKQRAAASVLVVALVTTVLAGCDGGQSASGQVRAVVQRYQGALANRNAAEMCSLLSSEAKRKLASLSASTDSHGSKPLGCIRFVKLFFSGAVESKPTPLSRIRHARIGTPKVVGDKATVLVREPGESAREVVLVKTQNGWRMSFPPPPTSTCFDLRSCAPAISVEPSPPVAHGGAEKLAQFNLGRTVVVQSGCLACHRIGEAGNAGPGPDLTQVGARLYPLGIERSILNPTPPMPSFRNLPKSKLRALVAFLSALR